MLIIRSNLYLRDLDRDNCVILDSIGSDPWEQCEGGGRGGQTACPQPITRQAAQARPAFRPDHNMSVPCAIIITSYQCTVGNVMTFNTGTKLPTLGWELKVKNIRIFMAEA